MKRSHLLATALIVAALPSFPRTTAAQEADGPPAIADRTQGMTRMEGYFNVYWDETSGKFYWEIGRWNTEFLYQVSLTTGLGSNPVGLDRGQLGGTYVLTAQRVGPRVLLVEPNLRYRARSDDPAEVRAVAEAFAPSTHWGFDIEAATDDRVLVDATDFFMRDAHGIVQRLRGRDQGTFRLDRSRSTFYLERTRAFPKNTEVEVSLTFTSDQPGSLVRSTAASGSAVTLRVHHSLVELPDGGYTPRLADSRVSSGGISFADYATSIDQPLWVRWISRHRLQRRDFATPTSDPIEPIVYYVDPGTPEPIRSALIEGASWWNDAFEFAGFTNAFRVEVLPDGADPMDLRYNMIHWTHRSTRGWSYGGSVRDPRTGEILKGNVNLGSLRLKQDFLLATGLTGAAAAECDLCGGPGTEYLAQVTQQDPVELALARVRQLAAHEVGHTLGFAHNYIASTYGGRASVMDYPAPLVEIVDERLDLSNAYAVGIGAYDRHAVAWAYTDFAPGVDEEAALEAMVRTMIDGDIRFISDRDASPAGGAHPLAALWDNGADPIAWLRHEMEVRRIGIESFTESAIDEGDALASLEEVFLPLYLHHRYQVEAAAKSIGGIDYYYAVRGDGQPQPEIVSRERQLEALDAVLETISPEALAIPERIVAMIPPRAFFMSSGETFGGRTGATFDPIAAAATASELTLRFVLQPQRMARLVEFHARDGDYPSLEEVIERTVAATWGAAPPSGSYLQAVQRATQRVLLDRIMVEAGSARNAPEVRAILTWQIHQLREALAERDRTPHIQMALEDIDRWLTRPEGITEPSEAPDAPAGSPIGG